ncbi:hypothetical protein MYX64_09535 [Nitrospinae bacterium AH_259_B05_G02_I21]|nr:hypothetical protein [Nitrospinae bacterium AH_259_B05_G02_I21]
MVKRRKAKPRRKKRPQIRIPVPPPGGPLDTKRGRKGYERSREQDELDQHLDEIAEQEEEPE